MTRNNFACTVVFLQRPGRSVSSSRSGRVLSRGAVSDE